MRGSFSGAGGEKDDADEHRIRRHEDQNGKQTTKSVRSTERTTPFMAVNFDGSGATVKDLAAYLGLAERTIRDRIKKMGGEFELENGVVRHSGEMMDNVHM